MNFISNFKEKIAQAIDVRFRLVKLTLVESASKVLGYLIFALMGLFLSLATLIFLGFGLSEVFAYLTDSRIAAHFITAGIFVVLLLILISLRKNIMNGFINVFVRMLTEQDEANEHQKENDTNLDNK